MSSSDRLSNGELTENDGFSVVAATSVTQRFSTLGSSASCWVLEKRCTSSMKRTVSSPPVARRRRASSTTWRTSFTPAVTAESSTNRRPETVATRYASVVLPTPGGPHRITEPGAARRADSSSGSTSRRSGEPGTSRCA